ncbi:MAG: GTP diphosphokinase [Proteobacteria bacterium]|nr:GTP diphosphokinase [Pseudomonadota bacterium]
MVKITEHAHILPDGSIDLEIWLHHLSQAHHYKDVSLIRSACILSQLTGQHHATEIGCNCLQQGLAMAEVLSDLEMDQATLAAAIVYNSVQYADLNIEDVQEQLGQDIAKLVEGVQRMDATHGMRASNLLQNRQQLDNLRKMLLAMVDDVRIVLIKLAERLSVLRAVKKLDNGFKKEVAEEVMEIYAPLANRLGIGHIKWEMEDLAFHYLQPEQYKNIAKGLKARRLERDHYVEEVVSALTQKISAAGIQPIKVYGRSKHIHSIFKKMQRKSVDLDQIYDATAVRVLVPTVDDCYSVLSIVHHAWKQIPEEFDDYIANPKPNGYRSLHTAVIGPDHKNFEVQIRTFEMHDSAELGVAAHWKYKESVRTPQQKHEDKIEWLREILAWQQEMASGNQTLEQVSKEFIDERIYVFTPNGDIFDLPREATPLDFAYHIHSEIGHRCRGAKVNDAIVPLTYQLKTGDRIEILTTKQGKPSRDWLNPHLGYLKTARAKAKIHHWFKQQDYEQNVEAGRDIFEREIKKLHIKNIDQDELAKQLNMKEKEGLFAGLATGDITLAQVTHIIQTKFLQEEKIPAPVETIAPRKEIQQKPSDIKVEGIGNLLTTNAKCCKPLPGDPIIGYITQGRGVSIHKQDCPNILHANHEQRRRFIELSWGTKTVSLYPVNLIIKAYDRQGLLKDITTLLTQEKISVIGLSTTTDKATHTANIPITIEISDITTLSKILDKLEQISNVISVTRVH